MTRFMTSTAAICLIAASLTAGFAQAQPRHDMHHGGHNTGWHDRSDWRKGGYVARNDWDHGARVDYRSHHLSRPPRGYEWRQVNGNYVLAAVATGVIASLILSNH